MKSLMQTINERQSAERNKPGALARACEKLGLPVPKTEAQIEAEAAALRAKHHAEAELHLFTRFDVDPKASKRVAAARTAIVPWLNSLPPARLQQPFFMPEFKGVVALHMAHARVKHKNLSAPTIAVVLYELGFIRGRDHGSNRPQTRYWIHPAAVAHQRAQKGSTK